MFSSNEQTIVNSLVMMTRDIKFGLIPNGYSGYDSRPLYNSVDSSLLLFEQIGFQLFLMHYTKAHLFQLLFHF